MTGHVSGFPVEELLPTLISGGGALLVLRLRGLGTRLRLGRSAQAHQASEMEDR
jgi:hypothetical protein